MRRVRGAAVLAAVLVLAGCWAVPGAGPTRSGHNPTETVLTPENVSRLVPAWTWQAEWTTPRAVLEPVTSPGGVHISVGHKLVTLDPATGVERWRAVLYDAGIGAQVPVDAGKPAVSGGRVLVPVSIYRNVAPGTGTHSYDEQTGADRGLVAPAGIEASIPRDGRVVGTYGTVIGSGIGTVGLFVTDERDATKSWSANLSVYGTEGAPPLSSPAVGSDRFFIAFGGEVRSYSLAEPTGCYFPFPGSPYRFCPSIWSRSFGAGLTRPTLAGDDRLLVAGDAGHVWALEPTTGAEFWSGVLPTTDAPSAPPSIDAEHVYVVAAGRLALFDRGGCDGAACNPVWSADSGGTVATQPAIAGGVVYTATTAGRLRAFPAAGCGAATCAPLWEHDLGTTITGGPVVSLGRLFVGTADGRLIAFQT